MATLIFTIDTKTIGNALTKDIPYLEKYMQAKLDKVIERLANEVALPIAQQYFEVDDTDNNDAIVSTEKTKDGYLIKAVGESVCFIEFGAGVSTDPNHPFAGHVPFRIYAGSWSETHSRQFTRYGYWVHNGVKYEGVEARRGMYEAYKAILTSVEMIIHEEFGQ